MKKPILLLLLRASFLHIGPAILLICLLPAFSLAGAEAAVKISDLPPAALKTVRTQLGTAKLGKIVKSVEGAEVSYDVEMMANGKTRTFTVSEEGELLALQVFLPETPRPVQQAIRAHTGRQGLGEIFKHTEDGEVTYEVEMTKGGKTRNFTLDAHGKLLEMQMFLEETPAPVRSAIQKELRGGSCDEIYKTTEEDEVNYDVTILRNGKSHSLTFDPAGNLVYQAEPIQLAEAPEPVRKTLTAQLAGSKLISLEKAVEDGETTYEVEFVKAGKRQSLSLTPDGQILPPE